jgi:AcrR family transcriptional regulator
MVTTEEHRLREPLTRERVIQAALEIMDAEGLEAVTMRRIARALGVEAMSLYNHVRDKDDLLDGVCARVLSEFRVPQDEDWRKAVRLGALEYRRVLLAHPEVMTLFAEEHGPFSSPESLQPIEFALDAFHRAGMDAEQSAQAFHVFGGFIQGFVQMQLGSPGSKGPGHGHNHLALEQLLQSGNLPRLAEALPYFIGCDFDQQFDFGLDLLIDGIAARVRRKR